MAEHDLGLPPPPQLSGLPQEGAARGLYNPSPTYFSFPQQHAPGSHYGHHNAQMPWGALAPSPPAALQQPPGGLYGIPRQLTLVSLMPWMMFAALTCVLAAMVVWEANPVWIQDSPAAGVDRQSADLVSCKPCGPSIVRMLVATCSLFVVIMVIAFIVLYFLRRNQEINIMASLAMYPQFA